MSPGHWSDPSIAAALRVAARHGLVCEAPVQIGRQANVLVHLAPAPVVARVQTATARVRDPCEVVIRALEVTGFLVGRGAPVAAPSTLLPPGPHEENGLWVSFWEWYDHDLGRPLDPAAAGRLLAEVHDALVDFPGSIAVWDPIAEARTVLAEVDDRTSARVLTEAADRLEEQLRGLELPQQVVHGDAHLSNVLRTPAGPLWTDWEITHTGARAWDLASLVIRSRIPPFRDGTAGEEALAGYGRTDAELVDLHVELYALFQSSWWLAILQAQPDPHLAEGVAERMAWWRGRSTSPGRTPR